MHGHDLRVASSVAMLLGLLRRSPSETPFSPWQYVHDQFHTLMIPMDQGRAFAGRQAALPLNGTLLIQDIRSPTKPSALIKRNRDTRVCRNSKMMTSRVVMSSATSSAPPLAPEMVAVAHEVAEAAAQITSRYFRTQVPVDVKGDASPVTIADREAEAAMREVITARFPEHAIFGEEAGFHAGTGDGTFMWVLDPIDGTKSFITGKPLFGTLISLLHHGTPVLGIIDQPILKERWLGVAGQPSNLNGTPIATRACPQVSSAYMYSTTPHMFEGASWEAFQRIRDSVRIPLYGCDCYAYGLLAAGHCDLVVEADLKPYDYLSLVPVIEGAGGIITDWRGQALRWDTKDAAAGLRPSAEVVAAGDAACHRQALDLLAWK